MIINGKNILHAAPIADMIDHKVRGPMVSHGLSEAGYDIRIRQDVVFENGKVMVGRDVSSGHFALASSIELFQMPPDLVGIVHDKSTWARMGLSVFNTVIEPGFRGGLTLELVYHGNDTLVIPAGSGIAQVIFHETTSSAWYVGKYQDQDVDPVNAILG